VHSVVMRERASEQAAPEKRVEHSTARANNQGSSAAAKSRKRKA
jgi:hypothetical protein